MCPKILVAVVIVAGLFTGATGFCSAPAPPVCLFSSSSAVPSSWSCPSSCFVFDDFRPVCYAPSGTPAIPWYEAPMELCEGHASPPSPLLGPVGCVFLSLHPQLFFRAHWSQSPCLHQPTPFRVFRPAGWWRSMLLLWHSQNTCTGLCHIGCPVSFLCALPILSALPFVPHSIA